MREERLFMCPFEDLKVLYYKSSQDSIGRWMI